MKTDPNDTLYQFARHVRLDEPIPLRIAVALEGIDVIWARRRDPRAMMAYLAAMSLHGCGHQDVAHAAIACAKSVARYIPADEYRPAEGLAVAENWLDGIASMDDICVVGGKIIAAFRFHSGAARPAIRSVEKAVRVAAWTPSMSRSSLIFDAAEAANCAVISACGRGYFLTAYDQYSGLPTDDPSFAKVSKEISDVIRSVVPHPPKISQVLRSATST